MKFQRSEPIEGAPATATEVVRRHVGSMLLAAID